MCIDPLRKLLVACVAAATLLGCADHSHRRAVPPSVSDVPPHSAPPQARIESVPPPRSATEYWVPGYWKWEDGQFAWRSGRWVSSKPDAVLVPAYWTSRNGQWIFHGEHWRRVPPTVSATPIVSAEPPPLPMLEDCGLQPSPSYIWIPGYWNWSGGRHLWTSGRWAAGRGDSFWVPPHWVQVGINWRLDGGYWERV